MAFRKRNKSYPFFSQEFLIQNHADIVFSLVIFILIGLMFEVSSTPILLSSSRLTQLFFGKLCCTFEDVTRCAFRRANKLFFYVCNCEQFRVYDACLLHFLKFCRQWMFCRQSGVSNVILDWAGKSQLITALCKWQLYSLFAGLCRHFSLSCSACFHFEGSFLNRAAAKTHICARMRGYSRTIEM